MSQSLLTVGFSITFFFINVLAPTSLLLALALLSRNHQLLLFEQVFTNLVSAADPYSKIPAFFTTVSCMLTRSMK